jgi:hypothetical protein
MQAKWYAAPTAIAVGLIFFTSLVTCTPPTTIPTSIPSESESPSISTSSPSESGGSETLANLELYYCGDFTTSNRFMTLQTIYSKSGNSSLTDYITVSKSPWVMNYKSNQTSNIGYEFYFDIWQGRERPRMSEIMPSSGFGFEDVDPGPLQGVYNLIFYDTGQFNIDIRASGCAWWIKVGIEPDTAAINSNQKTIAGKWQHGISSCPPSIAKDYCEKIKQLPENKLYYLEFFEDGRVDRIISGWSLTGGFMRFGGRYSLIGSKLEINWDLQGYESYEIKKLSEDELVLTDSTGVEQTFHRIN